MDWQVIVALVIVIPIILIAPVLIWGAFASGLYQVVRDATRRRMLVPRRQARPAEQPVAKK